MLKSIKSVSNLKVKETDLYIQPSSPALLNVFLLSRFGVGGKNRFEILEMSLASPTANLNCVLRHIA